MVKAVRTPNAAFTVPTDDEDHEQPSETGRLPAHADQAAAEPEARESAADAAARIRAEREAGHRPNARSLNGMSLKLQVHGEVPGFQLAIVNDDRNRVQELESKGWQMVKDNEIRGVNANVTSFNSDPGSNVRFGVGTKENGEPLFAYLMKYPQELWDEEQSLREAHNARVDSVIRRGDVPGESDEEREGRYTKPFGVSNTIGNTVVRR